MNEEIQEFDKFREYAQGRGKEESDLVNRVEKLKKKIEDDTPDTPPANFVNDVIAHHHSLVGTVPANYEDQMKTFAQSLL